MDSYSSRFYQVHCLYDKIRARLQVAQMLERARTPQEIKLLALSIAQPAHVERAERYAASERRFAEQFRPVKLLRGLRMIPGDDPPLLRLPNREIGGEDVRPE